MFGFSIDKYMTNIRNLWRLRRLTCLKSSAPAGDGMLPIAVFEKFAPGQEDGGTGLDLGQAAVFSEQANEWFGCTRGCKNSYLLSCSPW